MKFEYFLIKVIPFRSQNDTLRAEIVAQLSAHKLSISSIEGQAHSAWLNARQAERKLEESRMEAAALRRRLTSIAENPTGSTADLMSKTKLFLLKYTKNEKSRWIARK